MLRYSLTRKGFQRGANLWRELAHAARAAGQTQVAFTSTRGHSAYSDCELSSEFDARSLNAFGEPLRSHAGNRLFTRCINGKNNHRVGTGKRDREFVHQVRGA